MGQLFDRNSKRGAKLVGRDQLDNIDIIDAL